MPVSTYRTTHEDRITDPSAGLRNWLAGSPDPAPLHELARAIDCDERTTHLFLVQLEHDGYVRLAGDQLWELL